MDYSSIKKELCKFIYGNKNEKLENDLVIHMICDTNIDTIEILSIEETNYLRKICKVAYDKDCNTSLVNKEDLQTCLDILEKNGLERVLSEEDDADVYHYFCNRTGLHLELHTHLFGKGKSAYSHMNNIFTDVFEDADIININGVEVSTFSLDKHFLYVICHAIKHFVGCGTGIRQLCDICMYIEVYYNKINWNYIWN